MQREERKHNSLFIKLVAKRNKAQGVALQSTEELMGGRLLVERIESWQSENIR